MANSFPALAIPYSRLSRLGYGIAVLILAYAGIGMVSGMIGVDHSQRIQQIGIGLFFLLGAVACALPFVRMFRADNEPVLLVDQVGIWDRRLTAAPIPWSAITRLEGIAPGFMERLAMPGSQAGKILMHIAPEARADISFVNGTIEPLHSWLVAGQGKLRIFHGALDARFPLLIDALLDAEDAARQA